MTRVTRAGNGGLHHALGHVGGRDIRIGQAARSGHFPPAGGAMGDVYERNPEVLARPLPQPSAPAATFWNEQIAGVFP